MPLPPHLQITMNFARGDARASCILYYLPTGGDPIVASNIAANCDAVQSTLATRFAECMAYPVTVLPCTGKYTSGANQFEATSTDGPVEGGVGSSSVPLDCMPEENAIVIQRRTNLAGRSKRGRIFVPFVPETFANDSTINAIALPILKSLATDLVRKIEVSTFEIELMPVQPDWKNSLLHQVQSCRVVSEICSRMDRRLPRRPVAFLAPSPV